jgi:hypothetical protein
VLFASYNIHNRSRDGSVEPLIIQSNASPASLSSSAASYISILDLAEALTQSLLLEEVSCTTFTISTATANPTAISTALPRIQRNKYYDILRLDSALESSPKDATVDERESMEANVKTNMIDAYGFKNADTYKTQLEEDIAVEGYWKQMFAQIPRDSSF